MDARSSLRTFASESWLRVGPTGLGVSALLLVVLGLFILPVPSFALDLLISLNILLALVLLLRALFSSDGAAFFSFPAILLVTTLYRLGLNVASTRRILLYGDQGSDVAGRVIESFGSLVVEGDFLVGAIVFIVIAVVNFLVIARGSARVAEVAARFSLDSLPGKQLAIDADLRAGSVSQDEATERRAALMRESQFYGAMDGAMRFVQGDAIAVIVIALVNSVGGVLLGVQRGLEFGEALRTFGVLTIGDGLVSIVPSLIISVCAGIVVTRISGRLRQGAAGEIFENYFGEPLSLVLAATVLMFLGIVRSALFIPFASIGLLLMFVAWRKFNQTEADGQISAEQGRSRNQRGSTFTRSNALQPLVARIGIGKTPTFSFNQATWNSCLARIQDEVYLQRGIALPLATLELSADLPQGKYSILVRGQPLRNGQLFFNQEFACVAASTLTTLAINSERSGQHPIDGRMGTWVNRLGDSPRRALTALNVSILGPEEFLATESVGSVLEVVEEFFGVDETKLLVDRLKHQHPTLAHEVVDRGILTLPELTELLKRLVRECVNIRDLKLILEGVAEYFALYPNKEDRTEWFNGLHASVRRALSRGIVTEVLTVDGKLRTFVLSTGVEEEFRSALTLWDAVRGRFPAFDPEFESNVRTSATRMFGPVIERGATPIVVLCPSDIRPLVQEFFSFHVMGANWLRTIAYEEVTSHWKPESVGVIQAE